MYIYLGLGISPVSEAHTGRALHSPCGPLLSRGLYSILLDAATKNQYSGQRVSNSLYVIPVRDPYAVPIAPVHPRVLCGQTVYEFHVGLGNGFTLHCTSRGNQKPTATAAQLC